MPFLTPMIAWLTGRPWFVALVKWSAIAVAAIVAVLMVLSRAKKQGADQERAKSAEAGIELTKKQAEVPHPLPGQTSDRLGKGTF